MEPNNKLEDKEHFKKTILTERRSTAPVTSGQKLSIGKNSSIGRRFSLIHKTSKHPAHVEQIFIDQEQSKSSIQTVRRVSEREITLRRRMSNEKDLPYLKDLIIHSDDKDSLNIPHEDNRQLCAQTLIAALVNFPTTPEPSPHQKTNENFEDLISEPKKVVDLIDSIVFGYFWFTELPLMLKEIKLHFFAKETSEESKNQLLKLTIKLANRYHLEVVKSQHLILILEFLKPCFKEEKLKYHAKVLIDILIDLSIQQMDLHGAPELTSNTFRFFLTLARIYKEEVEEKRISEEVEEKKIKKSDELLKKIKGEDIEPETFCVDEKALQIPVKECCCLFVEIEKSIMAEEFNVKGVDYSIFAKTMRDVSLKLLQSISYKEFTNKNFSRDNNLEVSPNILRMGVHFEKIAKFVPITVLKYIDPKQRAKMFRFFIHLAEQCAEVFDFHSACALIIGLENPYLSRLASTMKHVSKEELQLKQNLMESFDPGSNYQIFRTLEKTLQERKIPYIPMLPLELRDITAADEAPTIIGESKTINLSKLHIYGDIFKRFYTNQKNLTFYHETYLDLCVLIENMPLNKDKDSDEIYELSIKREPKLSKAE